MLSAYYMPCRFLSHYNNKRYYSVATRITNMLLSSELSYRQAPQVYPTENAKL
jgi:hypothetical protein